MMRTTLHGLILYAIFIAVFTEGTILSQEGERHDLKQIGKLDILQDLKKADLRQTITYLKLYLSRVGNLPLLKEKIRSKQFDNHLQTALHLHRSSGFNLSVSGFLDSASLGTLRIPRCGREDVRDNLALMLPRKLQIKHWKYIPGNRMWHSKRNLTYAFSRIPESGILSSENVRSAIGSAFASWAAVIALNFAEIKKFRAADIRIEFFSGDHGDGSPFDGRLGILSHAFAPEDGRFHLDSDEIWTVDMKLTDDDSAIDVETVALHEIGHLIGLDHSNVHGAVMFPSIEARDVKRDLTGDDIQGARALYGPRQHLYIDVL